MIEAIKNNKITWPLKRWIRSLLTYIKPPELPYLELHLTDHCNLNCKGCGHFSPIAPKKFADLQQHEKDMKRLRQLFRNIHTIRIMGGEPLLHPQVESFIVASRRAFPKAVIKVVTNGILLPSASEEFWNACRDTHTSIDLTVYPPIRKNLPDYLALCEAKGITIVPREVETFFAHHNLKGDSDKVKAFDICRSVFFCPFLQEGRLYTCALPALVHYFNERFGQTIAADEGINIHSGSITGGEILRQLQKPIETCKWCSYDFVDSKWDVSKRVPEDWDANIRAKAPGSGI